MHMSWRSDIVAECFEALARLRVRRWRLGGVVGQSGGVGEVDGWGERGDGDVRLEMGELGSG